LVACGTNAFGFHSGLRIKFGEGHMSDPNRIERLQIMLTEDELSALDDWRFERRMPSRAAAVRELLKRGLAAEGRVQHDGRGRSRDFGVTGEGEA
jgi:hypothetical protein